jgi:subtilisin family serine protease
LVTIEPSIPADNTAPALAPLYGQHNPQAIQGRYIVVFKKGERAVGQLKLQSIEGLRAMKTLEQGFVAAMSESNLDELRRDPRVAYIEADQKVRLSATQNNAPWNLDRIDQRNRPLNASYTYSANGSGVNVYVVDSGIRTSHTEFGGRARVAFDATGGNGQDCNGHGTHVAGIVGGTTYGVAKGAKLHGVRVLDCGGSGTLSGVLAGIEWITKNHQKPAVANVSLEVLDSTALDEAVRNSIAAGVTYTVAAGNSGVGNCINSPARVGEAITVGSTGQDDSRSYYSNFGTCLDLFAPGEGILSSFATSDSATFSMSGTSMSAPMAAGAAALYLQNNSAASPANVHGALVGTATSNSVANPGNNTANKLLFMGQDNPNPAPQPQPNNPCPACESLSGNLSGPGAGAYLPNGSYYHSKAGTHKAWLRGPSGTDFDLYLWKWNGGGWEVVASSASESNQENASYTGSEGYYIWIAESYSGSGAFGFWLQRP